MAHSRISERKISQYEQAKQLQSYAQQQEQQAQNARNDSTISRIGQTLGDFFGNLAGGVVGAVEGIIDFGATVVGGIGGLFDDDFKGEVQDFVSYNWTQDKVINPILEGTQGSYINDASENVRNIVRGVASGVGQMLPAVAVTVATGGLGAPAAFAQGAGLATIGLGAAGGGVQEAFQEGADYGEALGYGILSGGLEVAIEKLSGGLGKQFIGKGLTDDLIKNVARKVTTNQAAQKGLRILMEAGGEAAEEWTSEFLNPYLKRMTYDSDAELSTRESRLEAALIGGLTSLAFRGTVGQINTHTQQASEALSELQTLEQKESKLWGDDKLTETKQKEIDDFRLETKQTLSEQLQKMSNKRRADFISSYKLEDMVNADGTLKGAQAQAESVIGETDGAQAQSVVEGAQAAQKVNYNRAAYSPALYGKESELRFAPTQSALTADEVKAKQYFSKLNRGKRNANLVFTDDMPDVGGAFARGAQDKNTVYINRKANAMEQVIVHEMTHFARGTKEYKKLQDFVLRESNQEFIDGLAQDISETYGIDLQELVQKSRNFDKLSAEEAEQFSKDYSEVLDEVVATYVSEHIFTDEKAINSLAEDNRSLVKRIYKWIKNKIEVLTKGKTKAERDAIKYLQKAEKLYANALESAAGVADGTKRYSLSEQKDSKGNALTEAQAEFFKDSKIRDKNGNLLVVYHGTANDFFVFDKKEAGKSNWIASIGFWFTTSSEGAKSFAKSTWYGNKTNSRSIEAYLNITNPKIYETKVFDIKKFEELDRERGDYANKLSNIYEKYDDNLSNGIKKIYDYLISFRGDIDFINNQIKNISDTYNVSNEDVDKIKQDVANSKTLRKNIDALNDKINELKYTDAYQQFRTDVYKSVGMSAKDANFANRGIAPQQIEAGKKTGKFLDVNEVIEKFKSSLIADGYDGIIIKGTNFDIDTLGEANNQYVAFDSNQIKLTTNKNPTKSDDIRYSLEIGKDSVTGKVQRTKNLVALHNLSEEKLLKVFELGGFPMPSIAVTRAELPHTNYGEITIVFDKNTIDPRLDSRNVVYDRDAWTPTYPAVDVKLSDKKVSSLIESLQQNLDKVYKDDIFSFFSSNYEDSSGDYAISESKYTKEQVSRTAQNYAGVLAAYLKEKGVDISPVYSEPKITIGWYAFTRDYVGKMFDYIGLTKDITRYNITEEQSDNIYNKLVEYKAKEKYAEVKDNGVTYEQVLNLIKKSYNKGYVSSLLFAAEDYYDNREVRSEYDKYQTVDKLQSQISDMSDFNDWIWNKVKSTFERKGIANDSDIFDSRGNRRTFAQRHYEYNVNNILKAMLKGEQEGKQTFGTSSGALAAKLSKRFKSIKDIQDAENYLSLVSEEEIQQFKDKTYEIFDEIVTDIAGDSGDSYSYFTRRDDVASIIKELATVRPLNVENIKSKFEKETRGYNLNYKFDDVIANKVLTLFEMLQNIPTTFFEAKPRRVVEFDEIKYAIIPKDSSEALINALDENNIQKIYYDTAKETERTEIVNSLDDIRFSLSPRQIAERTLPKKYTKSDAKRALDDIMGNLLYDNDSKAGEIKGKNKTAVLDMLYRSLNEAEVGKRINYADRIAEYIINNAAAVDLYEDETNYENIAVLDTTKDYLRKINLSDKGIRAEIESRYGKDYAKVIYSMWGARKGEAGVGADVAYSEIVNQLGFGQDINNEADAFFQIADWYVEARDALRKKANETLDATLRENERAEIKAEIVRNVLKSFEKYGEETQLYQLVKRYEKRIAELKDLVTETKQYNRLLNKAIDSVAKISTLNNKDFAPASQLHDDRFKPLISKLSKIKWRSELIRPATRDIVVEFGDTFYNASNPFLTDAYQDEVANAIGYLRERKQYFEQEGIKAKPLDAEELRMLNIVTDNIYHVFKNYDTFIKDGKRESVTEYAKRGVDIIEKSAKDGGSDNFVSRVIKKVSTFIKNVVDPATVMKWGDGFYTENGKAAGVLFELYNDVRLSETKAKAKYIELITPLEDFFKNTKGYRKHYTTGKVTIAGKEIPLAVAMSLSLTAKQNDVWGYTNLKGEYVKNGLGTEGFGYVDKNGDFVTVGAVTKAQIAEMENQFTSEDKQYLGLVRDFFDKGTSPLLRETDMTRKGYTTVNKQNYFPTQRYEGGIAKDIIGMSQYQAMTSTLSNPSFLKERKTGARGKYQVGDIFSIVQKHATYSTLYSYMAMPLENFSRVYNKNVAENDAPALSLKTEVNEKIWNGFDKYLDNLFGDISRSNRTRDFGQNVFDRLASSYAKFQLGFNLKTIVGQPTSYIMASVRLDFRALMYGVRKVNFKQFDKYCPYAKVRDYEGAIVLALSMSDNIGKIGDATTKLIQKSDRLTCGLIFNACQWQVQKEKGFKIGTEENLVEAGKLAEEVIRDTQSNSVITEKSGLMRNKNMVVRWFTMFSSDAMKQVSRFVESIGEYNALRRRIKNGETGQEAYLKKMRDKIARTTTAILVSNLMFVLVGQFFKWLYDKDRIDKEGNEISVWEDLANDYIGQIIGLLPVARDIYSFLGEGYEVNGFIYGTINDLLGATDDIVKVVSKLAKGEVTDTPDFMLPLRNSIYAVGQLLGIPTRNIYNVVYGLTKRFSPESAYKVNSLFYDAYLTSDLNEAIEKGDDDLAQTIVGVIMDGEGMADDEAIQRKIVELAKQGFSAIPRRLGDTITYNGEQIKLTNNQAKRFAEVYGGANNAVKQLLQNSGFDNLSPEVQAKSIKFVYDYYWQLALEDMLGEGLEEKKLLFATAIPIDKLAYIVSYCQSLESDKDRKGNTVSGSLKTKITTFVNRQQGLSAYQKYMVMAYLGYRSTTAESKIKAYVNRLDLTKSQRERLLEYCGY